MENILTLLFTALIVPFLTAFFNKENWTGGKKFSVSLLVTIIFGGVVQFAAVKAGWQAHDGMAVLTALGTIFTGAQGFYRLFPNAISSVEKNVNGVPAPTPSIGDLVNAAVSAATPLIVDELEKKFGDKVTATAPSMAGIAGAVPSEPQAQLGGPTIPVAPLAATSYAPSASALPITPAPSVQAQTEAITSAITVGTPVEKVVDAYAPVAG